MNDIQSNKPFTINQISQKKPRTPTAASILTGYVANSMNGAMNRTIAFKKIMAGEKHREYRLQANIKMLTPLTPTYQNLKMTIRTYFVPNSRVWENAEKYTAQKGGYTVEKVMEIPNLGGKKIPKVANSSGQDQLEGLLTQTTRWRDSFIASYIPRIGEFNAIPSEQVGAAGYDLDQNSILPKVSVLPLRGRIAIYNDMERNKEYDSELYEFNTDEVTEAEWQSYLPSSETYAMDIYNMRGRKNNNYYTDYRTELQGMEEELPGWNSDTGLLTWASVESKIAEYRSQAENAQKNDWEIIAELRGSKLLTEGKVQKIGEQTFNLNYSAVTQSTYNTNENVNEEFQAMGTQGAYSYTEVNIPLYAGMEFVEEGYIHVIAQVTADTVYEKGFDRNELNVTPLSEYRPDMLGDKKDVLYEIETDTETMFEDFEKVIGFKRKYSEYFKLPNVIAGDMTTDNYFEEYFVEQPNKNEVRIRDYDLKHEVITNKTFQFFEKSRRYFDGGFKNLVEPYYKKPWLDYTDLLINKNQAVLNKIFTYEEDLDTMNSVKVGGQNQVFFVGVTTCVAELPIDDSIKSNYTTWGEH